MREGFTQEVSDLAKKFDELLYNGGGMRLSFDDIRIF